MELFNHELKRISDAVVKYTRKLDLLIKNNSSQVSQVIVVSIN